MPTSRPGKLDDTARFMTDRRETAPSSLDRLFQITERGSTISREVRGGFVTFFTMAYIIVLNPLILGFAKDADGQYLGGGAAPDLAAIAAGTALVLVGFLMMQQVTDIDWKNIEIAIPAFLTIMDAVHLLDHGRHRRGLRVLCLHQARHGQDEGRVPVDVAGVTDVRCLLRYRPDQTAPRRLATETSRHARGRTTPSLGASFGQATPAVRKTLLSNFQWYHR